MNTNIKAFLSIATVAACLAATAAEAASIRIQCEVRGNSAQVSVDGKDVAAGMYSAVITSGGASKQAPYQAAVANEVEFDFDSDAGDIAAGATAIPGNFVVGGVVTGKIVNAAGATVVADAVACRVRSR